MTPSRSMSVLKCREGPNGTISESSKSLNSKKMLKYSLRLLPPIALLTLCMLLGLPARELSVYRTD